MQSSKANGADLPSSHSPLRLVRLRLRLALLTMAVLPMTLSMAIIDATLGGGAQSMGVLAMMVALTALLVTMTVWMSHQVLRPAEELERSRTDLKRMYEVARADSLRDGLTGLGNHRAFQEELDRELEWYQRYKVPVALLLIDVDDLKLVNDSAGHAAGDEMLREMGRLIAQSGRIKIAHRDNLDLRMSAQRCKMRLTDSQSDYSRSKLH